MKGILESFIVFLMSICLTSPIYGQDSYDVTNWIFKMLTKGSDQNSSVVVSKYYDVNNESDYGFCLESSKRFLPISATYYKNSNSNRKVLDIVKAYNNIGLKDDNYYIAAQLMIWKEIEDLDYTFNGEDYSSYRKDIENEITRFNSFMDNVDKYDFYLNDLYKIDKDFSKYYSDCKDIEVISNSSNGFVFKLLNNEEKKISIEFYPIDTELQDSYVLHSETSQDLIHFEGKYSNLRPFKIEVNVSNNLFNLNYSKLDTNGNSIKNAEFTLYQLDDNSDDKITFIKNDIDVDLCEALSIDKTKYDNLNIKVSERYSNYLKENIIHTKEIGYFDYEISDLNNLIDSGRIYVTSNDDICKNSFNAIKCKAILSSISEDKTINNINGIERKNDYYLCESEPAKGYTYSSEPCVFISGKDYSNEKIEFINDFRTFTLKLVKQSNDNIPLNGAEFKLYYDDKQNDFVTGSLFIENINNSKYLFIKGKDMNRIIEVNGDDYYSQKYNEGRYYYYFSDSDSLDESEFIYYVDVIEGGFNIVNLPYSSSIILEETKAPQGYIITDPIYTINPNIKYSEITLTNYRVNYIDIIPGKKFIQPKTCVE